MTDFSEEFKQKVQMKARRRDYEHGLWHSWKGGDQTALPKLYQSLTPLIRRTALNFRGNLPESYIDAVAKKHLLDALHTWDPNRGVQLNTHILNRMQKVKRDVSQYQNPGRLAESSHYRVVNYQNTHANLQEDLGRTPTREEMATTLGKRPEEIDRLRSGTRRDMAAVEGQNMWKTPEHQHRGALLEDFSKELPPLERDIFHMTFGMAGHDPMQAQEIARSLGLTPGRVSQIKGEIAGRFSQHHFHQAH